MSLPRATPLIIALGIARQRVLTDVSWLGTQKGQRCHNNTILPAVRVLGGGDDK